MEKSPDRKRQKKRNVSSLDKSQNSLLGIKLLQSPDAEDKGMLDISNDSNEYVEEDMEDRIALLFRFLCSTNISDQIAEEVMRKLVDLLYCSKDENRVEATKYFLHFHGIPLITMSLYRWGRKSREFTYYAIKCLYVMIVLESSSAKMIVDIGGVNAILRVCQKYRKDEQMVVCAIRLLDVGNVIINGTIGEGFTTKECVDFVFKMLKAFPKDQGVYYDFSRGEEECTPKVVQNTGRKQADKE